MTHNISPRYFQKEILVFFLLNAIVILSYFKITNKPITNTSSPTKLSTEKVELEKVSPNNNSNYPEPFDCDETTLLVGDLLPSGDGQTVSFPFGVGNTAPPACTDKLNYGGEGLAYCENNDNVYIARFAPDQIGVWDLQTNSLSSSIPLSMGSPYDVAMTSDCNYLYVATTASIERINLNTNTVDQTRLRADFDAVAIGDGEPWGIDIHPTTGEIFITFGFGSNWASHGGGVKESSILKVGSDLQGTITEVVPNELHGLFMGMKFLPNGNFWVTWDGEEPPTFPFPYVHSEEIRLYNAAGTLLDTKPIIIGGNQEYFTEPNDIAFGPDGNIYVTTYAEYCVVRYMTATDTWEEYLGLDPSGATGKNLEFVCSSVFCLETCGDGIDNDGDGLIDCADNECPSCISLDCDDGVQVIATAEETASGLGISGTPSLANFFIPEGNNRAILIAAFFEREHCQSGDDCSNSNTAGTGLGDNFASSTPSNSPQITARFTGSGGSLDKLNPLFLPDGDLRFGVQVIGVTDDYSTTIYSREAFYFAIYENDIDLLLSGASSGNITVILPDVITPIDEADEAIILGYAFANVGQTSEGIVRSGSDISQSPDVSYAGNYTLSDIDLDYLQEPNEPEDGVLVLGMNGIENYGFENMSGFSTVTNISVTNNSGDFQEYNEADGFSLNGQFGNGPASGILDNISMQSSAPSSLSVNGGLMAVFTIESCSGVEICGDGIDNDSDGDKDFDDSECDICNTTFISEKFYISKYGSSTCGDDVLVLDWEAGTTTASNEQNLGQDVGGSGWSDIAFTPDGNLYANWTPNTDNMELYSVDPLSGRFIRYICEIDGANPYITQWELVSDIDGYLYTVLGDGTTTALYKYKPTDLNSDNICDSVTLVIDLTATGLVGDGDLAWSNGLLYWSATASNNTSSPAQLVEIDIQAGTYNIHPLVDGSGNNLLNVDAVVNDSEGNLIIGDQNSILYEVDKNDFSVSVAYNLSNSCGAIGGLSTRYEFIQSAPCSEDCTNGIDDDGDGLIDCDDPDCSCCKAYSPTLNGLRKNDP